MTDSEEEPLELRMAREEAEGIQASSDGTDERKRKKKKKTDSPEHEFPPPWRPQRRQDRGPGF